MKCRVYLMLLVFFLTAFLSLRAQVDPGKLKKFINQASLNPYGLQQAKLVKEFYNLNNYNAVWLVTPGKNNITTLSDYIISSASLGLYEEDYQPLLFKTFRSGSLVLDNEGDSVLTEIRFTDAAIHFFRDVLMGNRPVSLSYNGLNYYPSCFNIPQLLFVYINSGRLGNMLSDIEPKEAAYLAVKSKLNIFLHQVSAPGFKDVIINKKTLAGNKTVRHRLYQLGFLDSDTVLITEPGLKTKIKEAQKLFGLLNDGLLRNTTIAAMNVPLQYRIDELRNTLNTIRWLSCIRQTENIVIVNIPSATLLLYEQGRVVLESRIVVGKNSTTTPTLSSKITEVILYPYWNVPYKIATQELLPLIKRNRGYLDANNFQVLNTAGKIVNPATVNWWALSTSYFPYTIRQSTGCDNSLGLLKLNFYNPYSVYLHDTPYKNLFMSYRRYYSHGCMRLEKAIEVGHYLLKGNTIAIDTLEDKGCLLNQEPVIVPVTVPTPVFVLYNTAWIDSANHVTFYADVYDKLSQKKSN